jgi:hypothetical protein
MLHYYEIDIVPAHDDRAAAILLSIVNQVSDSQFLKSQRHFRIRLIQRGMWMRKFPQEQS